MSDVRERIVEVVSSELCVEKSKIVDSATLFALGANSLDVVTLYLSIEDEFGLDPDKYVGDNWGELTTIAEVVKDVVSIIGGN